MKPGYAKRRNDRIVRSGAAGPDAVEPMALVDCRLPRRDRSEEHTSELQSQSNLVCRLLLEKKKNKTHYKGRHRARWHVDSRKLHTRDSLQERRTIGLRMQAVNLALADALTVLGMNTLTIAS